MFCHLTLGSNKVLLYINSLLNCVEPGVTISMDFFVCFYLFTTKILTDTSFIFISSCFNFHAFYLLNNWKIHIPTIILCRVHLLQVFNHYVLLSAILNTVYRLTLRISCDYLYFLPPPLELPYQIMSARSPFSFFLKQQS